MGRRDIILEAKGKGLIEETDTDLEAGMYETIIEELTKAGYIHYEISNFAKPGKKPDTIQEILGK